MQLRESQIQKFQNTIWQHYKTSGRGNLPWRKTINPYRVWVSEIMLQQTQVDRVVPFFNTWMKQFPTVQKLADASQLQILKLWKGLGYNSRTLRMKKTAQVIMEKHHGKFPKTIDELQNLPGIGPYTAGAITAFAYDMSVVMIETNIRRTYLHHFFGDKKNVHDQEILDLITQTLPQKNIRQWYWALMDYGSHLGRELKIAGKKYNPNVQSRHYAKQSKFQGSDRQIRGKILELLLGKSYLLDNLRKQLTFLADDPERIERIISQMEKENFLEIVRGNVKLKK